MIDALQAGLTASALFLFAIMIVALVAFAAAPVIKEAWIEWRKRRGKIDKVVSIVAIGIAIAYGGSKPHPVPNAGADEGIDLVTIEAEYDSTNDVTAVDVKYTAGDVTVSTPVSVRNAESEQWRALEKIDATVTTGQTNVLAFAVAGNAATNRFWWVGVDTPPVVIEDAGITITNFVATSKFVHIAWTCENPKATDFAFQRRRKGTPVGLPYDMEVEYLESSGTQWIETAVQTADKVQMGVWVNATGGDMKIWGNSYYLGRWADISWYQSVYRGTPIPQKAKTWDTITIEKSPRRLTIDRVGETFSASSWWAVNNTLNSGFTQYGTAVPLFGHVNTYGIWYGDNKVTGWHTSYRLRMSFFKAWRDGVLIRDLIPVRVGQVGCMYDRVSGELFGNAGSGNFGLGADNPWETIATTTGNSFNLIGFTVGESWEYRIMSTYTEGE